MASSPLALSDRDRLLLESLAEQRWAVLTQAAHWLGVREATAARRVRRLHEAGLVRYDRIYAAGSPALQITQPGLRSIGHPAGPPGRRMHDYRHDVGVGWLWTAAREGAFGEAAEVISERRMRSHDLSLERMPAGARMLAEQPRPYAVGIAMSAWDDRRHYADLMIRTSGGRRLAIELELTGKSARRLDRVMENYSADLRIDAVLYLVPNPRLARQVSAAAARAGISDLVHVRQLTPGGIPGVDSGTTRSSPARSPERKRGAITR